LPIVSVGIALPPRIQASIPQLDFGSDRNDRVSPGFRARFWLPQRQHRLFQPKGARSVGTISAHCRGVNWKMGKLTWDQTVMA
jgi:hypothetical protein